MNCIGRFAGANVRRIVCYLTAVTGSGHSPGVHLIIGPEGHRFYADLAWPVFEKMLKEMGWQAQKPSQK